MLAVKECWIDSSTQGRGPMNTVERLAHQIRTAQSPETCLKSMFDLAFYMQFTKVTNVADFAAKPNEWAEVVIWCIQQGVDITPKFTKPIWTV